MSSVERQPFCPGGDELTLIWHHYTVSVLYIFNSLAAKKFDYSLKWVNFKLISTLNILSIFCEIAIRWMPQHLTDH